MSYRIVPPFICWKVSKFPVLFCLLSSASSSFVSTVVVKAGSRGLVEGTRLTGGRGRSLTFQGYIDLLDLVFPLPP